MQPAQWCTALAPNQQPYNGAPLLLSYLAASQSLQCTHMCNTPATPATLRFPPALRHGCRQGQESVCCQPSMACSTVLHCTPPSPTTTVQHLPNSHCAALPSQPHTTIKLCRGSPTIAPGGFCSWRLCSNHRRLSAAALHHPRHKRVHAPLPVATRPHQTSTRRRQPRRLPHQKGRRHVHLSVESAPLPKALG